MSEIVERIKSAAKSDPIVVDRPSFSGDPVRFLIGFMTLVRHPQRAEFAFDHEDLQWCADVWEQAAIVSRGDEAFLHEQRKFQKFCDDLKQGIFERKGEIGIVFLESQDWPPPRTIIRAARLLERAEVRGIH